MRGNTLAERLPGAHPTISGFTYLRPLGTGGFSDVFLYRQEMPHRDVAVKVLLRDVVDDDVLRMFATEADVLAALSAHPHILTIHQASVSADGRPFLVMEYCVGSYASRYRSGELSTFEVLDVGARIGSAVATAHAAGMLHRDVKPANVLVTPYGQPVLSDFGVAGSIAAMDGDEAVAMSVPWSSPEIVDATSSGSVAADVWGLGATIYALLAGHSPFERPGAGQNSVEKLKARIRKARYTPIGRADVPPALEAVLQRAMAPAPADRYQSVTQLVTDLQHVQSLLGVAPSQVPLPTPVAAPIAPGPGFQSVPAPGGQVPGGFGGLLGTAGPPPPPPANNVAAPTAVGVVGVDYNVGQFSVEQFRASESGAPGFVGAGAAVYAPPSEKPAGPGARRIGGSTVAVNTERHRLTAKEERSRFSSKRAAKSAGASWQVMALTAVLGAVAAIVGFIALGGGF